MQICPSFPEPLAENYFYNIKRLSPYFKYFQIDFADGILVDNKTASVDDFVKELLLQDKSIFENLEFDFHLMVKDYESEINKLEKIKNIISIKNVLIHFSVVNNFVYDVLNYSSFPIGITLNPEDSVDNLKNNFNLNKVPSIQIMSVIPGAQGRPFMPDVLNKIEQLRLSDYRNIIFLDGAVNDKTLPIINSKKFKPDVVCPGSFLTKCPDDKLKERYEYLLQFK